MNEEYKQIECISKMKKNILISFVLLLKDIEKKYQIIWL